MNEIYNKIAQLRKSCGMSQADLAKRLGISRSAVNAWEMDISKPHINHVIAMSKIFRTTTDFLLNMKDSKHVIDISDLSEKEKTIITEMINMLASKEH